MQAKLVMIQKNNVTIQDYEHILYERSLANSALLKQNNELLKRIKNLRSQIFYYKGQLGDQSDVDEEAYYSSDGGRYSDLQWTLNDPVYSPK